MKAEYDFSKGVRGAVLPPRPETTRIGFHIDDGVLDGFRTRVERAGGGDYQSLMNAALREHVERRKDEMEPRH